MHFEIVRNDPFGWRNALFLLRCLILSLNWRVQYQYSCSEVTVKVLHCGFRVGCAISGSSSSQHL